MSDILDLFITRIYRTALNNYDTKINSDELEATCFSIAHDDVAGQNWCEENDYSGYTSYASLDDLPWRFPIFKDLVKALDLHIAEFAKELQFDLGDKPLVLNGLWINILPEGGIHTGHIHPNSVISGTTYVSAVANQSGTGTYVGAGLNIFENTSVGVTQYMDLGGYSGADATFLFVGYQF